MAESYRGLTIRIGGDTTQLTQALRAANGAASQTQTELRKVGQALKLDPNNITAYNLQLQYMSNKAQATAMKLAQLKDAAKQIGSDPITLPDGTSGTVESLSKGMKGLGGEIENVATRIAVARTGLATSTSELATMHNELSGLTKDAARLERKKIGAAFDLAVGKRDIKDVRKQFEELNDGIDRTPEMIDEIVASAEAMGRAIKKNLRVDEGDFNIEGLREALKGLYGDGSGFRLSDDGLDRVIERISEFGKEYQEEYKSIEDSQRRLDDLRRQSNDEYGKELAEAASEELAKIREIRSERAAEWAEHTKYVKEIARNDEEYRESIQKNIDEIKNERDERIKALDDEINGIKKVAETEREAREEAKKRGELAKEMTISTNTGELQEHYNQLKKQLDVLKEAQSKLRDLVPSAVIHPDAEGADEVLRIYGSLSGAIRDIERDMSRDHHQITESITLAELQKATKVREIAESERDSLHEGTQEHVEASRRVVDAIYKQIEAYENLHKAQHETLMAEVAYDDNEETRRASRSEVGKFSANNKRLWKERREASDQLRSSEKLLTEAEDEYAKALDEVNKKLKENAAAKKAAHDEKWERRAALKEVAETPTLSRDDYEDDESYKKASKAKQAAIDEIKEIEKQNREDNKKYLEQEKALKAEREQIEKDGVAAFADVTARKIEAVNKEKDAVRASASEEIAVQAEYLDKVKAGSDEYHKAIESRNEADKKYVQSLKQAVAEGDERLEAISDDMNKADAAIGKQIEQKSEEAAKLTEKTIQGLAKFGKNIPGLTGEIFNNKSGNTGVEYISTVLDKIAASLGLSTSEAQKFKDEVARITGEFKNSDNEVKQLEKVMKFDDLIAEITKTEAGIKSLAKAMNEIHAPSDILRGMYVLNENAKELETSYKTLSTTAKTLSDIHLADPSNMEAATAAVSAFSAAEMVATENANVMRNRVEKFDASAMREITDTTKSSAQQLFDAGLAAQEAQDEYDTLSGKLQYLIAIRNKLEGMQTVTLDESILKDEDAMAEFNKRVEEAAQDQEEFERRIKLTETAVANADLANRRAAEGLRNAKMRKEYEELSAGALQWEATVKQASRDVREAFVQMSISEAFGDTSSISRLESQVKALMSSASAFGQAMKLDTDNTQLAESRFRSLSDAEQLAVQRVSDLNANISKVDTRKVDELREKYGSVTNAAERLRELSERISDIEFDVTANPSYLKGITERILDPTETFKDYELEYLPESVRETIDLVRSLGVTGKEAMSELVEAEKAVRFEEWTRQLAEARTELEAISKQKVEFAIDFAMDSQFGELDKQLKQYDDAINVAVNRAKKYADLLKKDPDNEGYKEERMRAVAEATELATKKTEILNSVLEGLDSASVEELRERFGSLSLAASSTKESLTKTNMAVALLRAEVQAFANENGKDDEWVRQFEEADAEIGEIPPELSVVRDKLIELGEVQFSQQIDAQLAAISARFEQIGVDAATAKQIIVDSLSEKVSVSLDDSFSKSLKEASDQLKEFGFRDTGADDLLKDLDLMKLSTKANAESFETYKKLLQESPKDHERLNRTIEAAKRYAESLRDEITQTKKAIDEIDSDKIDDVSVAAGTTAEKLKAAQDRFKSLSDKVTELEKKLKDAKQALADMGSGADKTKAEQKVAEINKELDKMKQKASTALDELVVAVNTDKKVKLEVELDVKEAEFDKVSKAIGTQRFGDKTDVDDAAVTQIFSRISQYAERVGRKIIESADTIDAAYRDMRKTVQGTEEEFQRLHDEAVKFSQTSIVSADQMLEMEALGGQLGIATESLQSFGENASNLLIATDFDDAEELALKLGQLTNVMGDLDESTFENFADALVRLGNNTATTESGIMNVAQRMSSVANVTSMTTPQLLAWSAAIASTGQRSEAAATAVTKTITGIGQAVAGGGDTLVQFAQIAGMTADEFREAWANSSSEALEAFVKGLETLSDDSTDAIEALDSVGITSVRQETALLGLSQTIENLDASIKMSQDAFDGVSDQWGDAGDAAREAQRKSEGFSGSLQILKNNAANLAASLGESLVGPMNLVSAALRMLTDLFTGLPKPIQSATVLLGGIAVAVGPVANAVKQLKKAWEEMTAAMAASKGVEAATSTSSGDMAKLMSSLKGLIPAFKDARAEGQTFTQAIKTAIGGLTSAEGAAGALGSMLSSGLFAVGIGAAIAVVSVLVTEIASAIDRTNRLNEAKQDLAKATDKLSDSARGAVNAEKEVANSIYDVRKGAEDTITKIEEMARKQEQLADSIKGRNTDYKAQAEMVNEAREAISKYMNVSNLSNEAQGDLMSAVHMLNSELGTTYEVVDSVNGIVRQQGSDVNETRESFEKYVDSQLRAAKAEGVLESIKETERALIAAESELTESKEKMNALTEESSKKLVYNKSVLNEVASGTNLNSAEMNDLSKTMESQQSTVDSYRQTLNELKEEYRALAGSAADSSQQEQDAIAKMAYGMSEFKGVLSNMSEADDFAMQIQSLGATSESFGALTHEQLIVIAQAYDHSVGSIEAALSRLGISFENALSGTAAAANTLKMLAEGATASLTPATTEEVNKQKKLDTAAYNARKKQLDQEYKDKQKSYDADYKAKQKELDKIYKAEQKASQNYLKMLKEQQSEEVESFKEATDAKLKEIEREYEAKKELLELEYERYDKDIDDRIQAIKDEQDAEDEAVKQRERREKLEELGKAVETAKTKKKREEAEKALSDYKDQLAREDTKKQRDAQIQALQDQKTALKEQLSERQEELKKSYDEAVSSYKAAREEELKILQKQHEIAYESENEFQTERLESIKEAHSAELEDMKETQQAELELIKERNDQELSDMKEKQEEYIEAMKDGTAKAMANINNALEETASKIPQVGELIKAGLVNISEDGVISFTDEFKKMPGVTDEVMQLITDKIREAIPNVEITAEGIAKAVEKPTKDAANQIEQSVTGSFKKIADAMLKSKDIDLPTYLNAINGLPPAIEEVFNKSGLSVQNGLDEVARRMLESGKISLSQYLDIMNGMPGSTRAICNETGVAIAEELGLFNEQTGTAASNLKKSVTSQFESMPSEVKGKSDEAGKAASSLGGQDSVDSAAKNSGSLYDAVMKPWSNVGTDSKKVGAQLPLGMASGISDNADKPIKATSSVSKGIIDGMDVSGATPSLAKNAVVGWNNSFVDWSNKALQNVATWARSILNTISGIHVIKSPSRKFAWLAEMAMRGYLQGWESTEGSVDDAVADTAKGIVSAFSGVSLNDDLTQGLIDNMRAQESRLLEQSRRMADIVERGFDPKLTVDAAYEALGTIDEGELRRQRLVASSQKVDNSTYAPVININIPEVVVREEADVDRLSQQIAIRVQRSINARIG